MGLGDRTIEVGLLLGDRIFGALDLVGASGVGAAQVEGGELALQANANRIRRRLIWCRLRQRRLTGNALRARGAGQSERPDHGHNHISPGDQERVSTPALAVQFIDHVDVPTPVASRCRMKPGNGD